jgi:hypothetical protein
LYNKGNNEPDLLYELAYMARKASEDSIANKVVQEYLNTQTNILEPKNLKLIFDSTISVEGDYFQYILENKEFIKNCVGEDKFNSRMGNLLFNEAVKQNPYTTNENLEKNIKNVKTYLKNKLPEQAAELTHKYALTGYATVPAL